MFSPKLKSERPHSKRQRTPDCYSCHEICKKLFVMSMLFVILITFVGIQKYSIPVLSASLDDDLVKFRKDNRQFVTSVSSTVVISKIKLPKKYESKEKDGYCCPHIGCFKEITSMFKPMKADDVKTRFTLYSRNNLQGFKIPFAIVDHHFEFEGFEDSDMIDDTIDNPTSTSSNQLTIEKYPYNLSLIEETEFKPNTTTRIIVAGYMANEEEQWISELRDAWLDLEDCNIIKVSWTGANHGLYWTAVANTRVVARQISVFLYYLNVFHPVDLDKVHVIGHSLGAHIAGFVGSDHDGKIARITGLDPAGPVFTDMDSSLRLDASDANFVDVIHTNAGNIMSGNLGISIALGHLDYYPNGGSSQPGCEMTISDPIESLACNHRASYRYLTEIVKRQVLVSGIKRQENIDDSRVPLLLVTPMAYLVSTTSQEDLVGDDNPKLNVARLTKGVTHLNATDEELPSVREVEFHQLKPTFPRDHRGIYYFKTIPDPPYYSEQLMLTMLSERCLVKKIVLYVRYLDTIVLKKSIDEIYDRMTFLFAKPNAIYNYDSDDGKIEDYKDVQSHNSKNNEARLQIYWRYKFGQINQMFDRELSVINFKQIDIENLTLNKTMTFAPSDDKDEIIVPKRIWYEMKSDISELKNIITTY